MDFIDDFDSALHRAGGKPEIKVILSHIFVVYSPKEQINYNYGMERKFYLSLNGN